MSKNFVDIIWIPYESLQVQRAYRMGYTPTKLTQPASHQRCLYGLVWRYAV